MRILVTVAPRMYRESLALTIKRHRPAYEVLLGATEVLDGQAEEFSPHLLIRNDTDGVDMETQRDVPCWIEILYSDSMSARVSLDGEICTIEDICTEELIEILDRTEELITEGIPANR